MGNGKEREQKIEKKKAMGGDPFLFTSLDLTLVKGALYSVLS